MQSTTCEANISCGPLEVKMFTLVLACKRTFAENIISFPFHSSKETYPNGYLIGWDSCDWGQINLADSLRFVLPAMANAWVS